jgi:DNA (cytosine-5)-methyltransferase 1
MPPEEEERKVPSVDDEKDSFFFPFTLSGEDAVEDDRNHPEPALLQQSEEGSKHWNKTASNNIRVNGNDETDSDDMSVNSIATQPGGISESSPSDNGLVMVEEVDGTKHQATAVPDNTTSAQEKSTKPIGIEKICGNGEKESPIEIFSDDEDDADEDVPLLREMIKEREDTDQSDEEDERNRKMAARKGGVSPVAMQTSQASCMRHNRRGRPKKNSAASVAIDDEDDRNICADERKAQPFSIRRSLRARNPPDLFIRHQKEIEGPRKRKGRVEPSAKKKGRIYNTDEGTYFEVDRVLSACIDEQGRLHAQVLWKDSRYPDPDWMMANDLTKDTFQDALRMVQRRGEPPQPAATPLAAAAAQTTQNRSTRNGTRKHRRKRISARIQKQRTAELKNTGEEGFLGTSENGDALWVVEKVLDRRIKEKGKRKGLGFEYLCRWEGYPKYPDSWQPTENLNERLLQAAFQQFPGEVPGADKSDDSQDDQGNTFDGVRYETYQDMVNAKHNRNQQVLCDLGFSRAEVDAKEDEAKEPIDTGNDHADFGHAKDEREASGGRGPLDRCIEKKTLPNYEKGDECERYDSFDPHFDNDDKGAREATTHEDNGNSNSYETISWQKEQAEDKVNDDEDQIRGTGITALPTRIPEERNRSRSPDISIDDCYSETDNTDEDEDNDDFDVRLDDLTESSYKTIGGLAEIHTADNILLRVGTSFHAENGRILTIRDLLGKEEIALCEIYIPSSDTLLSDTKAELDEYFPVGNLVKVPFSNLKKRCKEKFRRANWFYESGEIEKYDCALYRKEEGRRIPPTKLGKAKPTVLELFAGAGGMTLGFKNAGFDTKWAVEKNSHAAGTLRANISKNSVMEECVRGFIKRSVEGVIDAYPKKGEVDHIHASPPCQGVSRANRFGGANDEENNSLSFEFLNAVRYFEPKTATYENVKGLLMAKNIWILKKLIAELHCMGYQVRLAKLNSSDYGDPQNRKRVILWGAQTSMHLPMKPQPTHGKNLMKRRTVEDAIGCLKSIEPYTTGDKGFHSENGQLVPNHCARISTPTEEELERYTLKADRPAHTIKSVNHAIHYNRKRFISVREAASLQSFPIDHQFSGRSTDQFKQIGNAVPVMMATQIARSVAQVYGLP